MNTTTQPGPLEVLLSDQLSALLPTRIWAVGTVLDQQNWMAESLHWDEVAAAKAAKPGQFIVLCPIGEDFPAEAADAEKLYYPNEERWEESALFRMREAPNVQANRATPARSNDD